VVDGDDQRARVAARVGGDEVRMEKKDRHGWQTTRKRHRSLAGMQSRISWMASMGKKAAFVVARAGMTRLSGVANSFNDATLQIIKNKR